MPQRQHRGGFSSLFLIVVVLSTVSCQPGLNYQSSDSGNRMRDHTFFFYQRSEYPRDCLEILSQCSSSTSDGVYLIKPDGYPEPFEVYCNNSLDDGGWTVIQRRHDGSINFNRTWDAYQLGFGFLAQEHWLGNEKISHITNQKKYKLRIDITTLSGSSYYVTYDSFRISDGFGKYKIVDVGEYNGTVDTHIQWCPTNKVFSRCKCEGRCSDPSCTTVCSDTPACICPDGYLLDGDECIPREHCGCFLQEADNGQGRVLQDDGFYVNQDCTQRCTCDNGQISCDNAYRCSSDAVCEERQGLLQCYCNEGFDGNGVECTRTVSPDCGVFMGDTSDSIQTIQPAGWTQEPFQVTCDSVDGGGWLVFQRRIDSSLDFYRNWLEYKNGFGSPDGNFWLGNDKLAALTSQGQYELRIDFVSKTGQHHYANYSSFSVGNEGTNYRLSVSGYDSSSSVGFDAMTNYNGRPFSTHDRDNDGGSDNCASNYSSAWWYGYLGGYSYCSGRCFRGYGHYPCDTSNRSGCCGGDLNRPYTGAIKIYWRDFPGGSDNIQETEMKIRPRA